MLTILTCLVGKGLGVKQGKLRVFALCSIHLEYCSSSEKSADKTYVPVNYNFCILKSRF